MSETIDHERTLSKGAFALEIGVTPGRVSQMIAEGKIGPEALAGEGRNAKVRVGVAKRQIAARRDPGQALGNGLGTRVGSSPLLPEAGPATPDLASAASAGVAPPAAAGASQPEIVSESFDAQYKREKLAQIQRQNRKAAEEEAERRGRFMESEAARTQMARIAGSLLSSFEGSLQGFATAVASRFGVPQRDVLHLLRAEFRGFREAEARRHRAQADALPETVDSIVEEEIDA